jgi:hypothetical protein
MKFKDLLSAAIGRSEIPLRFEPGAEEALEKPLTELLRVWLEAHAPQEPRDPFDYGRQALIDELVAELTGERDLPQ